MRLSTRNQLAGTVTEVTHGSVMSTVKVELRGGDIITASITLEALGLSSIAHQIEQAGVAQAVDRLSLDGMLALWHPAGTN